MRRSTLLHRVSAPPRSATSGQPPVADYTSKGRGSVQPKPTRSQLWFAAVKPPMYTVAVTPILVGSFAAYADTHVLDVSTLCIFLLAAVAIIAWVNLTNDVFDFDTGVDENKPESVVNLCGGSRRARHAILALSKMFLVVGFTALYALSQRERGLDGTVLTIMGIAVFMGYAYQGPPFRLSYIGLGEPICFITWSITVCAAYYAQLTAQASTHDTLLDRFPSVLQRVRFLLSHKVVSRRTCLPAASLLVASATTLILFCSHFHQEEDDRKVGKRSPIVRLGVARASRVLTFALVLFGVMHIALFATGLLPWQVFVFIPLSTPHVWRLGAFVHQNYKNPSLVRPAKYYAVKLHFIHGVLLSLGYFLTGKTTVSSTT